MIFCVFARKLLDLQENLTELTAPRGSGHPPIDRVGCLLTITPVTSTMTRHFIAPPVRCQPSALYYPPPRFATVSNAKVELFENAKRGPTTVASLFNS